LLTLVIFTGCIKDINEDTALVGEICEICGDHYIGEDLRIPTPPLNMREFGLDADDAFIASFDIVYEATLLQWETDFYDTLVLWADEPITDFAFVSLIPDAIIDFDLDEIVLAIDELLPNEAIVLNVAFEHYLHPRGGIRFIDQNGVQYHTFIWESMRGGCYPRYNLWLHNEAIWNE